jgi:putative peptidoglycan lipid II flippase
MVPVGVIAQAAGVAAYPFFARLAARGDTEGLTATTSKAARDTVFVAAAATAGLLVLARPLVRLLYQWGAFTATDAELVTRLLMIYALSVPAWGLHQILSRHFYAKRRMWTPVLIGTVGTVIAVPVWSGLYSVSGVQGFAMASVLVMSAYALALLMAWGVDSGWPPVREVAFSLGRGLVSAAAAVLLALPVVNAVFGAGELTILGGLGAALVGGLTALAGFLTVSYLLRAPELKEIMGRT